MQVPKVICKSFYTSCSLPLSKHSNDVHPLVDAPLTQQGT